MSLTNNNDVILVSEWDSDSFHRRVLELGEKSPEAGELQCHSRNESGDRDNYPSAHIGDVQA
jgi:hypothetical protein